MTEQNRWQLSGSIDRVHAFVDSIASIARSTNMKGVGLILDEKMIAGVLYEGFNGANVWMHVAAVEGSRWMTRGYLRYCFQYPFLEMQVQRVSGYVNASNAQARRLNEHLGFKQEAILKNAAPDSGDVIIYRMLKNECRFI